MIGPALSTYFLLRGSYNVPTEGLDAVKNLYLGIGAVIILIAVCFSFIRIPNLMDPHKAAEEVDLDAVNIDVRSEEHTSELQSRENLVCRLLLEKKKTKNEKRAQHA